MSRLLQAYLSPLMNYQFCRLRELFAGLIYYPAKLDLTCTREVYLRFVDGKVLAVKVSRAAYLDLELARITSAREVTASCHNK